MSTIVHSNSTSTEPHISKLGNKNFKADLDFAHALHGNRIGAKTGFTAILEKRRNAQKVSVDSYFKNWDGKTDPENVQTRLDDYSSMTKHFYNLVTDFYEYGWSSNFHFNRFYKGETFKQAQARHEHYLANKMNLDENMKVLDVGCGVGGPAMEITRYVGCEIVGLNNSDYQIERAKNYSKIYKLEDKLSFVKGDFMQMDFEPESFDAAYAIEATVHAPVLERVYGEIYNVLKPGCVFGVYEWVMTDKYDETNPEHRRIAYEIEFGNGIPKMYKVEVSRKALEKVGFEIECEKNLAALGDEIPWWYPLSGEWKYVQTAAIGDLFNYFRISALGRSITRNGCRLMESIGIAPKGTTKVTTTLEDAAINLVNAGKMEIFTPMMLFVARKPLDVN